MREILNVLDRVAVWNGTRVERTIVTTGAPSRTTFLSYNVQGGGPRAVGGACSAVLEHGVVFRLGRGEAFANEAAWPAGHGWAGQRFYEVHRVVHDFARLAWGPGNVWEFCEKVSVGQSITHCFYTGLGDGRGVALNEKAGFSVNESPQSTIRKQVVVSQEIVSNDGHAHVGNDKRPRK